MKTDRTPDEVFADKQKAMSNETLIGFATDEINELAKSYGKSHRMSIPPKITDTDMFLSELVRRFKEATHQEGAKGRYIESCKMIPEDYEEEEFAVIHIDYLHKILIKASGLTDKQ